jgi:hypothetical protein
MARSNAASTRLASALLKQNDRIASHDTPFIATDITALISASVSFTVLVLDIVHLRCHPSTKANQEGRCAARPKILHRWTSTQEAVILVGSILGERLPPDHKAPK